jgi:hypothetical protein
VWAFLVPSRSFSAKLLMFKISQRCDGRSLLAMRIH